MGIVFRNVTSVGCFLLSYVEVNLTSGLTSEELERLATLGTKCQKTARRDIAHVVSSTRLLPVIFS